MSKLVNHFDQVLDVCKKNFELLQDAVKRSEDPAQGVVIAVHIAIAESTHKTLKQQNVAAATLLKEDTNRAKFKNYQSSFETE